VAIKKLAYYALRFDFLFAPIGASLNSKRYIKIYDFSEYKKIKDFFIKKSSVAPRGGGSTPSPVEKNHRFFFKKSCI
jgi:hypothetical protein